MDCEYPKVALLQSEVSTDIEKYQNFIKDAQIVHNAEEMINYIQQITLCDKKKLMITLFNDFTFTPHLIDECSKFKGIIFNAKEPLFYLHAGPLLSRVPVKLISFNTIFPAFSTFPSNANMSYLDTITNTNEFIKNFQKIRATIFINLVNVGSNEELTKHLVDMMNKIHTRDLMKELEEKSYNEAIEACKELTHCIPQKIQAFIALSKTGINDGESLHQFFCADTAIRYEKVSELIADESEEKTFFCPVLFDNTSDPVLLLRKPSRVINFTNSKRSFQYTGQIMEYFKENVDSFVSAIAYNESCKLHMPIQKSPTTGLPITAVIPLGQSDNNVSYANYQFRKIFNKLCPFNPDIIFALLVKFFEETKVDSFKEMLPFVKKQLIYRLNNSLIYSNLQFFCDHIQPRIPFRCAVFYVLSSPSFEELFRARALPANIHEDILWLLVELNELAGNLETVINRGNVHRYEALYFLTNFSSIANGIKKISKFVSSNEKRDYTKVFPKIADKVSKEECIELCKEVLGKRSPKIVELALKSKPKKKP